MASGFVNTFLRMMEEVVFLEIILLYRETWISWLNSAWQDESLVKQSLKCCPLTPSSSLNSYFFTFLLGLSTISPPNLSNLTENRHSHSLLLSECKVKKRDCWQKQTNKKRSKKRKQKNIEKQRSYKLYALKKDECFYIITLPDGFIHVSIETVKSCPVIEPLFGLHHGCQNTSWKIPELKASFVGCFTKKCIQKCLEQKATWRHLKPT